MTEYSGGEMDTRIAEVKRGVVEMVFERLVKKSHHTSFAMNLHIWYTPDQWRDIQQELLKEVS